MEDVPLVPLKVLLGNPLYCSAKVSPDGAYISYLKPSPDKDVLNVWIRKRQPAAGAAAGQDVMVTHDSHRGVRVYIWSEDSQYILYLQDKDGDEDWHLHAQALDQSPARDLTPFKGVRADNLLTDPHHADMVLVGLNKRDPRVFDMYRLNITTGELILETQNPGDVLSWFADDAFVIRGALAMNPADGSKTLRVRQQQHHTSGTADGGESSGWHDLITWPQDEEGTVVGFAKDGRSIYVTSSLGRDTTELQLLALESTAAPGSSAAADAAATAGPVVLSRLASSPACDVSDVLVDKLQRGPQAVGFNYLRQEWKVLDPGLSSDFQLLLSFKGPEADLSVDARSSDSAVWLVSYSRDDGPVEYYVYDRRAAAASNTGDSSSSSCAGRLEFLFASRPELSSYKLGRRHPVLLTARDGVTLPSYLSLPPLASCPKTLLPQDPASQQPDCQDPASQQPDCQGSGWPGLSGLQLPLVLFVHGGPWARDRWGLDTTAQWFCNRGYAVLQVNYRASSGFGKKFLHLGDKQWGIGTMQHDLSDAVRWAVAAGIADPQRVAIYGGSYGGYACLAGLAFTPDLFCCGVDIVGPSHIRTLLQTVPAYWAPLKRLLVDRIGDAEGDQEWNQRISPLYHAAAVRVPLIIAQGANDPRVKRAESDQIYNALREKGLEVQYYLYEDEGHGFARPPNRLDFCSRVDYFLARHLKGRAEPPLEMEGSSVVAMHLFESLDDYQPGRSQPEACPQASSGPNGPDGQAGAAAAAAAATAAAAAVAAAASTGKDDGGLGLGKKVGLAVGIPAVVLTGAAAVIVAVLRGLSPRR